MFDLISDSPEQTASIAACLAPFLRPGDLLCLQGDLGAGKTTFTRALVASLGSPALVSSPTFTIIHEYRGGPIPVYHADAYRLRGPEDVPDTGLDAYLADADGVTVVEWPERIAAALPVERLTLTLRETGDEARRLTFDVSGSGWETRLGALQRVLAEC